MMRKEYSRTRVSSYSGLEPMVDVGNDLGTFVVSPFLTHLDSLLSYLASNVT